MDPIIKAIDVQYCTLQCPDLDVQERFLIHFGMHTVEKTDNMLLMRGEGPQPFIEKCIKGEKKFLSASFLAASMDDLQKLSESESFSEVEELTSPGGGFVTRAMDPDGIGVEVVYGIENRPDYEEVASYPTNEGTNVNRVNQIKRYPKGSYPKIIRFAHYGINSNNISAALEWYNNYLGIIPSDKLWFGDSGDSSTPLMGCFARLDRGLTPADHHSIFWLDANIQSEGIAGLNHVSFEMLNIDDVFMGHEILQQKKEEFDYELEWGVGRHYQGSQIFDYWRSPFKQTHEHQTDGDLLDNSILCNDINMIENTGGMPGDDPGPSQWGPPINLGTFGDKRGI